MLRFVLVILMSWGFRAVAQDYAGPKSLGRFRIDKDISMSVLFEKLGRLARVSPDTFCYRSADGHSFLVLTRMVGSYDRKVAGTAELIDFPNCIDKPVQTTLADLTSWRTDKGVGVGSSSDDVMKAYGKPSRVDTIGTDYRWISTAPQPPVRGRLRLEAVS